VCGIDEGVSARCSRSSTKYRCPWHLRITRCLPLGLKPTYSVYDLLAQHLYGLGQEAAATEDVQQAPAMARPRRRPLRGSSVFLHTGLSSKIGVTMLHLHGRSPLSTVESVSPFAPLDVLARAASRFAFPRVSPLDQDIVAGRQGHLSLSCRSTRRKDPLVGGWRLLGRCGFDIACARTLGPLLDPRSIMTCAMRKSAGLRAR